MIYNNINQFVSLKPAYYRFLKAIHFTRNISAEGCSRYDVEIIVGKLSGDQVEDLRLRCTNALEIKIGDIESMSGLRLEIEDIKNRQLEGVSYRITEQEEDSFSFNCSEFYVELMNELLEPA